jgi:hypothetical protein
MRLAVKVARKLKLYDLAKGVENEMEGCVKLPSGTRFTVVSLSTNSESACLKPEERLECYWTHPPGGANGLRIARGPVPKVLNRK